MALEEINEPLYKIDRMLAQHKWAGTFQGVEAFCLGYFTGPHLKIEDVAALFNQHFPNIPVAWGFEFGHAQPNYAIPIGSIGTLTLKPTPELHFSGLGL